MTKLLLFISHTIPCFAKLMSSKKRWYCIINFIQSLNFQRVVSSKIDRQGVSSVQIWEEGLHLWKTSVSTRVRSHSGGNSGWVIIRDTNGSSKQLTAVRHFLVYAFSKIGSIYFFWLSSKQNLFQFYSTMLIWGFRVFVVDFPYWAQFNERTGVLELLSRENYHFSQRRLWLSSYSLQNLLRQNYLLDLFQTYGV